MAIRILGWFRRKRTLRDFDCNELKENCSEYIEQQMEAERVTQFEQHMEDCPDCGTFVKTFRATVMTMRTLPRRTPSSDLKQRIRDRISAEGDN
jgi:hypothetical protein